MQAYISTSYSRRQSLSDAIETITASFNECGIEPFVFVNNYLFDKSRQKEMMQQAFFDIGRADILVAETSDKAIGISVEVGYAKAKGKIIIYLRQMNAEHSTTVAGTSDHQIIYNNVNDLGMKLIQVVSTIQRNLPKTDIRK